MKGAITMLELQGKYSNCKIFTDNVQQEMISQLYHLMERPSVEGSKIRIMPDCHAGAGCVIGTTMTLHGKVIPNVVGVDIGCGVLTAKLDVKKDDIDFEKLDQFIRENIPNGHGIHERPIKKSPEIKNIRCKTVNQKGAEKAIGSLGGGNHFIELDYDKDNHIYLVVHSGSRHLGLEVANHYQLVGYTALVDEHNGGSYKDLSAKLISQLKAEGRQKEIEKKIKEFRVEYFRPIDTPKPLAHVAGEDYENYLHDMKITQKHAALNRQTIIDQIVSGMGWAILDSFDTIHNYIELEGVETPILRKGAVAAYENQKLIIPMNMRDGSLICIGKGNPDWNFSAPHGAGRILSRAQAKKTLSMEDFHNSMNGIFTTSVSEDTIDESAMAYKPMQEIMDNIKDTVEVVDIIKPIYNFKAAE